MEHPRLQDHARHVSVPVGIFKPRKLNKPQAIATGPNRRKHESSLPEMYIKAECRRHLFVVSLEGQPEPISCPADIDSLAFTWLLTGKVLASWFHGFMSVRFGCLEPN